MLLEKRLKILKSLFIQADVKKVMKTRAPKKGKLHVAKGGPQRGAPKALSPEQKAQEKQRAALMAQLKQKQAAAKAAQRKKQQARQARLRQKQAEALARQEKKA